MKILKDSDFGVRFLVNVNNTNVLILFEVALSRGKIFWYFKRKTIRGRYLEMIFSSEYIYIRSRQLEGTFSQGREVGVWVVTTMRVAKGWGNVEKSDWPFSIKAWPPEEQPGIDELAKKRRVLDYQRIRDGDECRVAIAHGRVGPVAAFKTTNQWFSAVNGIIEEPSEKKPIIEKSHSVWITGYDDDKRLFKFMNSWGKDWGDHGFGYLSYEYFDKYMLESWTANNFDEVRPKPFKELQPGLWVLDWGILDVLGGMLHGIELYQKKRMN